MEAMEVGRGGNVTRCGGSGGDSWMTRLQVRLKSSFFLQRAGRKLAGAAMLDDPWWGARFPALRGPGFLPRTDTVRRRGEREHPCRRRGANEIHPPLKMVG